MGVLAAKRPKKSDKHEKEKKVSTRPHMRRLATGEVLFNEKDKADTLFIIQKGQLRLFVEKGDGFVDIGILRKGEVIGEMSYFEEGGGVRSCSAAAILPTEVVEVQFIALNKKLESLNIWFKTIINTLIDRLKKANQRLREIDGTSVKISREMGKTVRHYKFFTGIDVVRLFALMFNVLNSHAKKENGLFVLDVKRLKYYALEIYNLPEVKLMEFIMFLFQEEMLELDCDKENNLPIRIKTKQTEIYGDLMFFFENERTLTEEKQTKVSSRCEIILLEIYKQLHDSQEEEVAVNLSEMLKEFKKRNMPIYEEDLDDAVKVGIATEIEVGEGGKLISLINVKNLKKLFPCIRMVNGIDRVNKSKEKKKPKRGY